MNLIVKLADGRSDRIAVPEGTAPSDWLDAFIARTGLFASEWVTLVSGESVRYDQIVSVRPPREGPISGPPVR